MIWVLGIVGVIVLLVVVWSFWPHRRGIADGELRRAKLKGQGRGEYFGGPGL